RTNARCASVNSCRRIAGTPPAVTTYRSSDGSGTVRLRGPGGGSRPSPERPTAAVRQPGLRADGVLVRDGPVDAGQRAFLARMLALSLLGHRLLFDTRLRPHPGLRMRAAPGVRTSVY